MIMRGDEEDRGWKLSQSEMRVYETKNKTNQVWVLGDK